MNKTATADSHKNTERLPLPGLLALAMAAFITLLTEILPAGLLSSIAQGLDITESLAGQFITAYAVGALVAAIPVTALTQGMRRRPLLLTAIFGFASVNLITALSGSYTISLIARFFAGVFGGIVWSLLAGYAVRMSPVHLSGRAIAVSGAGATIALVLGVPLGSLLGQAVGWQGAFGLMSALALLLIIGIIAIVPDFPGQTRAQRQSLIGIFSKTGIRSVLFVVVSFIVAHNVLYIYLEPFLELSGLSANVDIVLFVFGLGSISGLWFVGAMVDRRLQSLAVTSIIIFACAALLLGLWGNLPQMVYPAILVWGLAFGGFATITQTALFRFAGESVDVAQSMYTTGWNTAVAGGGVVGGILLARTGSTSFAWFVIGLLAASLLGTIFTMNRALADKR
ncbi:MFS transporter [Brenneria goodwinii]|uniref:Major facilitator family transporter n=1 Tax=Brenneria goodwinii TaxID=1109412 RepID=A0A0G4K0I8_9GAMM|nr:MFS transporter [Brenneria goodwinii]CPR20071.1 Major facilitator family transporter [Brenneria goodwinii]